MNEPRKIGKTTGALAVRPLDVDTWSAFARLVEANNGVWGGCWCTGLHVKLGAGRTPAQTRPASARPPRWSPGPTGPEDVSSSR